MTDKKDVFIFSDFLENNSYIFKKNIPELTNENYNKILSKLKKSEYGYDNNNKDKIQQQKDILCSFVYFYPTDKKKDINLTYNSYFEYKLDVKLKNIPLELVDKLVNDICNISNKDNKQSFFIIDYYMQKYIKDKIKNDNNQLYTLYYLKVKTKISLLNLLDTKYNVYNESIDDILKKYYIEINNNIKSNNIDKVIDYLFFILDFYDKLYNSKWIKSIGEFYGLMSLILFLNSAIQINHRELHNPLNNTKKGNLEIDFYINDDELAIEIDGSHHEKNDNTKKNQIIITYIIINFHHIIKTKSKNIVCI